MSGMGSISESTDGAVPPLGGTNPPAPARQQALPVAQAQPLPPQGQPQQAAPAPAAAPAPDQPKAKYQIDPRPYAWLAENDPQRRQMVDDAAERTGVNPYRIALHLNLESGGVPTVPDGKDGEVGWMQVMPSTAAGYNPRGALNIRDPQDNLTLGARHIKAMDDRFGQDTPSSVLAYQSGPGMPDVLVQHPELASQHPNGMNYLARAFPGQDPQTLLSGLTAAHGMTPQGLIAAGSHSGPDGFLQYISQAKSPGVGMTDAWKQADGALAKMFAMNGDMAGVQHAHDYVMQMAYTGTNQYLMAAHQSLSAGDPAGAAQALAKSHAFFPDSTMGRFSVDRQGNLWGERLDEHDPNRIIGKPFQITPEGIQAQLHVTTDPAKFVALVQEQAKNAAYVRHQDTMGEYYANLNPTKVEVQAMKGTTSTQNVERRSEAVETAAAIRASRGGTSPNAGQNQLARSADKEADALYGEGGTGAPAEASPMERGQLSETYHDLRMNGTTGPAAHAVTMGVNTGKLGLVPTQDGRYAAVDPKTRQPVAYLSKAMGDRILGGAAPAGGNGPKPGAQNQPPSASPVGGGAASPYAQGANIGQNLTGTVMPPAPTSALPAN